MLFIYWLLCADVEDIYEDIQRPDHRGSNGWSSSEFESYDELSDSETVPPARSSSKVTPIDIINTFRSFNVIQL